MRREWILGAVAAVLLSGCPEDSGNEANGGADSGDEPSEEKDASSSDTGGKDAGTEDSGAALDPSDKVGTFTIRLVAPKPAAGGSQASEGYTSINGKVFDGPVPEAVIYELDSESGGCKLLKPRVPFCDPGCGQDVCVEDDMCQPNARAKSVGAVTISGLKTKSGSAADISIDPIAGSYSTPGDVMLGYPAFVEGDALKLHAAGAAGGAPFDVEAKGIAPLELTTSAFPLKNGAPLEIAWKAPSKSGISRIEIKLDISHHGGTKGKIECDVPDTGSLSIAGNMIGKLLGLGVAGFPTIVVARVSNDEVETAGGSVELRVVQEIEQPVTIDGLNSCTDDTQCPTGKKCQSDLTCK